MCFFFGKDETSPQLECKYEVKTDVDRAQKNNLQNFPFYIDYQYNHYEVDLLRNSIWIKKYKTKNHLEKVPNPFIRKRKFN